MRRVPFLIVIACVSSPVWAAETQEVGLTTTGQAIQAAVVRGSSDSAPVVVLVGGLSGRDGSSTSVSRAIETFDTQPQKDRRFTLVGIAVGNPEGVRLVFPPTGAAYRDNSESHALWRWIGIHAPDLVLVAGSDESSLARALTENPVAGIGRIPARTVETTTNLLQAVPASLSTSEARREIDGRRRRTPREVAEALSKVYGQDFAQFTYIPGMALIARLRLGHTGDVEKLVAPYVDGSRNPLERPNSLVLAGHLVMAELAARTGKPEYLDALRKAADVGFTETGELKESMPAPSTSSPLSDCET